MTIVENLNERCKKGITIMNEDFVKDIVLTPYNADFNNEGYPIGLPTVKELVAILRQLPQDYKVTCCGANNYLYLFEEDNEKYITIDNEWYLG